MNTVKGYEKLVAVYQDAHDQAAKGKGDERHANGQPFHEQRMQQISGLLRSSDGMAFQAIKKMTEGLQFEDHARREAELLGALNYIAGIVIYYRELRQPVAMTAASEPNWSASADKRIDVIGQNGNEGEHYRETLDQSQPDCEYTLGQVIGDAELSAWARWVAVDKDGEVFEFSGRPYLANDRVGVWNISMGDKCDSVKNIEPPADFAKCIWEIIRKGNELQDV